MRSTLTLIRREFTAYFWSPVAYVVLGVFLLGMGLLFHLTVEKLTARGPQGTEFPMQEMLGNVGFWLIFWVIPPLLTMRLFAEERSTGTLEMLMTAPVRDWQVVLSKFVACYLFFVLLWVPTLVYLPVLLDLRVAGVSERIAAATNPAAAAGCGIGVLAAAGVAILGLLTMAFRPFAGLMLLLIGLLATLGGVVAFSHFVPPGPGQPLSVSAGIDPMPVVASYLGLALTGAMFLALGLWVSSLVRSQIVAALIALALSLVFILGGLLILGGFLPTPSDTGVMSYRSLNFLSVPLHFSHDFSRGIVDTKHVVLYVSVTLAGLFLAVRSLERRRWQ